MTLSLWLSLCPCLRPCTFLSRAGSTDRWERRYSVWDAAAFQGFEPGQVFHPAPEQLAKGWAYFIVVQSRSGVEPGVVWDRVWPYLAAAE